MPKWPIVMLACVSIFPSSARAAPDRQTITINGATYGTNPLHCYGIALRFARACNGKRHCRIECNKGPIGCIEDVVHRPKDCWVWYTCSGHPGGEHVRAFTQQKKPHRLACP
jgi:hypothetical protein